MFYVAAKTKGLTTPQSSLGSSRMLASAQPKSHHAEKTKEKLRSSGRGGHRPKTHDGPRREHRTSHHSHLPRAGISTDGLRAGPKEIPHEVVRDREREVQPVPAGHAGLHPHREGTRRHSGSFGGHKPITKHAEEFRSKPVPVPLSASHRLSSDQRPLADAKLGSGAKGEAKVSAEVVCNCCSLIERLRLFCFSVLMTVVCFGSRNGICLIKILTRNIKGLLLGNLE